MSDRTRSPFGAILREERRAQGISQAELAKRIAARFAADPDVAELGVVGDRAIANIESAKAHPSEFVRPRPETVRVLMLGLGIDPTSERGQAMLRAANATQRREKPTTASTQSVRYETPFVCTGREKQWAALQSAWETAQTGEPQLLLIDGTAGVGKTRLVEQFCKRIIDDPKDVLLALGECSSGTATVEPYLPWRRAFSYALRAGTTADPRTARDEYFASALLGSVGKLGGVLVDLQDLQEWMAARAPERLSELKRIRDSWSATNTMGRYDEFVSIISVLTKELPAVVVLEDLHWADESSCSLLLHLQRQMRLQTDMPLLVIGTYRPSDLVRQDTRHPLLHVINEIHRQLDSVSVSLEATVENNEGRSFVEGLVDTFTMERESRDELVETLHSRTAGHPLFTTELIQRLVETKAIQKPDSGIWELDREKVETHIPGRMRAVIDERIQRLPDDARTIVEAASVQGSPFTVDVIPLVTGLPESRVDLVVDRELMEQHRIFRLANDPNEESIQFDHEVIAETVYESLSPHRRRSLHRRTAEALISIHEAEPLLAAPKAAHHFEQANMPAEAAEQALLTSYSSLAKLDHDLTLVWVARSERLARAANDDVRLWSARVRRAHVLRSIGSLGEAYSIGQEAVTQAQRLNNTALEAEAYEIVALIAYDRGQLEDAAEAWHHSIGLYDHLGRKDRVSSNQSMLSHVACRSGRLDAAIRHAQAAWAAAPEANRDGLGGEALLAEGNALLDLGRHQDAVDVYTRSLKNYSHTGEVRGMMLCRMNIAYSHMLMGNLEFALDRFDELNDELERLQTPRLQAFVYLYRGRTFEAMGRFADARREYQLAYRTRRGSGLTAMAGDELSGVLRAAMGLGEEIEEHLENLQEWWRLNDPRALEDPLLALLSLVEAYEILGNERLKTITLNEGTRMFLERANQIQNPAIRDMYLRGNPSGSALLQRAQEAGLAER